MFLKQSAKIAPIGSIRNHPSLPHQKQSTPLLQPLYFRVPLGHLCITLEL
jgi:hypothetical protein